MKLENKLGLDNPLGTVLGRPDLSRLNSPLGTDLRRPDFSRLSRKSYLDLGEWPVDKAVGVLVL